MSNQKKKKNEAQNLLEIFEFWKHVEMWQLYLLHGSSDYPFLMGQGQANPGGYASFPEVCIIWRANQLVPEVYMGIRMLGKETNYFHW